jgi:hypothetical protein
LALFLGGIIDFGTGAVYDAVPNPVQVQMSCTTAAMPPQESLAHLL